MDWDEFLAAGRINLILRDFLLCETLWTLCEIFESCFHAKFTKFHGVF